MENEALVINGKHYPMWSQFVEKKHEYIGGTLIDTEYEPTPTEIVDIILRANGENSAYFEVVGKDFSCGFDVNHGGISFDGFQGPFGLSFKIEKKK